MKKTIFLFLIGITFTSIAAGPALGDLMNPRQFSTAGNLAELQTLFNNIGATSISAYGDQIPEAYFEPTGAGNVTSAYIATVSYSNQPGEFGIYEMGNASNRLPMFSFAANTPPAPGYSVAVVFDSSANGGLGEVRVIDLTGSNPTVSTTYFDQFGFYGYNAVSGEGYLYSEDSLNPLGLARILTYESEGDIVTIGDPPAFNDINHWYVAAEIGNYYSLGGDVLDTGDPGDFSDIVIQMESIRPIPVPAAILLGILGMSVAGLKLRKFA
jgi:hypothetical protein